MVQQSEDGLVLPPDCWDHRSFASPRSAPSTNFFQFLSNVPSWEASLFSSLVMYYGPYEICHLIDTTNCEGATPPLCFVLDGSSQNSLLSFSWNLHSSSGILLAKCAGPGSGRPDPHQAEAFGFLSVVRFLHHLTIYLQAQFRWFFDFRTDALGLVNHIKQRLEFSRCYPNFTLLPDWDVIEAAVSTLCYNNFQVHIAHVRGHQDPSKHDLSVWE